MTPHSESALFPALQAEFVCGARHRIKGDTASNSFGSATSPGALWVRATMPYTISFEEASKIAPQIRDILMSYPQVTVVGSELGRPDDGTDPTGFFNCEFYVGLKPYKDKAWHGNVSDKKDLIESINKKLTAFPGIIFNYTQPAEDAVDEALTGLKSFLAVKIYGSDLNVLQDEAIQIKNTLAIVAGFTELTVVRELGQPSLLVDVDRDKIAAMALMSLMWKR